MFQDPPWAMKDPNGEWRGLTVDLWKELAADLKLDYRLVEESPDTILDGIDQGRLDTSAGPFAVTLERERELDFTHGYVVSGISIAVRSSDARFDSIETPAETAAIGLRKSWPTMAMNSSRRRAVSRRPSSPWRCEHRCTRGTA